MPDIVRSIFEKRKIISIRNPKSIRSWFYVLDALNGNLLLSERLYNQRHNFVGAWNFGPSDKSLISVEDLIAQVRNNFGRFDYKITPSKDKYEAKVLMLANTKAKKDLDWKPKFDLEKSVKCMTDWYNTFYKNNSSIYDFTNKQIEEFFNN